MSRKEYMRQYMASKRSVNKSPGVNNVNKSIFETKGRGVPVNGYVLVSTGDDSIVVTEADWLSRLSKICTHGLAGWSCKECL